MQRFGIIATALALSVCDASQAWAQAQSIQVPADQRALSDVLAKFNDLDAATPNDIQRKKIEVRFHRNSALEYRRAMCPAGSARSARLTIVDLTRISGSI